MKKMLVAIIVVGLLATSGLALAQGWGGGLDMALDMVLVLVPDLGPEVTGAPV